MKWFTLLILFSTSAFAAPAETLYTCTGGTGDVSITIERPGVVVIENTECGARMRFVRAAGNTSIFNGVPGDDSDLELCGSLAYISTNIFNHAPTIAMYLANGESAARYMCKLSR
jgi:hypothetical protein